MPTSPTAEDLGDDFAADCVCLGLRRAARLVTRRYEEALRPLDLRAGQFSVLAALGGGPVPLGRLADALGMDRTTLTRNMRPLVERGLVRTAADRGDRRVRALEITTDGAATFAAAVPLWRQAQAESARRLGDDSWAAVRDRLARLEDPAPDEPRGRPAPDGTTTEVP